jgi:glycosyltransferase involved in cell wall biosynthesis
MQLYGASDAEDRAQYGALYALGAQPGVTLHGPLAKAKLAEVLSRCRLMAYPNTFAETFCIAVLEGQAAGLPTVTSALAGLRERIQEGVTGHLIPGMPGDPAYDAAFVDRAVLLLTDDARWEAMSAAAAAEGARWAWERVVERWEAWFDAAAIRTRAPRCGELAVEDERATLLIDGFPREVEISRDFLRRSIAAALAGMEFPRAAKRWGT